MGTLGLIDLAGFVALLLWGLHMLQAGVMDAYGPVIRRLLRQGLRNRLSAFLAGVGVTTLLQSSTATGLVAAGFTATGVLDLVAGLAIMLGANVGTTLIVLLLSFDVTAFTPLVLLIGVMTSKLGRTDRQRDVGKAIIGLGLMLFALSQMTNLLTHASHSEGFQTLLSLVSTDLVLSVLLGGLLAWSMHSSIAVVLLVASFAQQNLIPLPASFALVAGANLGSAINPLLNMLGRKNPAALRLPLGNLLTRIVGCVIAVPILSLIPTFPSVATPASFHLVFNLVLALAFLPVLPLLASALKQRLPEVSTEDGNRPLYLDPNLIGQPALAIAAASREVMRMSDVAESMLSEAASAFQGGDQRQVDLIRKTDDVLDSLNRSVKIYLTSIPANSLSDGQRKRLDQVLYAATTLEQVGDIISNNLARRVSKLVKRHQSFSLETWADLAPLFARVTANVRLTGSVFMTGEKRALKRLFEEKEALERLEATASQIHLDRLRTGSADGFETSALEIDTLHDLRQINDHLAAIASVIMRGKKSKAEAELSAVASDDRRVASGETP